jgi:hypothetical protein
MSESCPGNSCGDNPLMRKQIAITTIIALESIAEESIRHSDHANAARLYGLIEKVEDSAGIIPGCLPDSHSTSYVQAQARRFFEHRND